MNNSNDFYPSAKLIAASFPKDHPDKCIYTFIGTFHRFVLAEFNTHRAFSRNSASSRAIPVSKMLELVETANVYPLEWGKNRAGMAASEVIDNEAVTQSRLTWDRAKRDAVKWAESLSVSYGVHKQVTNRLLEPFLPHTVIFTCDQKGLDHFFLLRCSPAAQPEIRAFAEEVRNELNKSALGIIKELEYEECHVPFFDSIAPAYPILNPQEIPISPDPEERILETSLMYSPVIFDSVARCARVSYNKHGEDKTEEDNERLFWDLAKNGHMSPFEHIAINIPPLMKANLDTKNIKQNLSWPWLQLRTVIDNKLDDFVQKLLFYSVRASVDLKRARE
jgi:thymidylate synthase ThyX